MKRNITPLLFGIVFILAGFAYIGSAIFNFNFDLFFDGWWTLFIIIPTFISLLSNGPNTFNICALLIGVLLLLFEQNILDYRYLNVSVVSAIVISIGVGLISKYFKKPTKNPAYFEYQQNGYTGYVSPQPNSAQTQGDSSSHKAHAPQDNGKSGWSDSVNFPNYNAILSGVTAKNISTDFEGARISAVMGGVDLDLRDVVIKRDVTIYATAVMGGIDVFAPQNVRISVSKTDILGSTGCKAYTMPPNSNVPIVTFICTTVMGGIDIK